MRRCADEQVGERKKIDNKMKKKVNKQTNRLNKRARTLGQGKTEKAKKMVFGEEEEVTRGIKKSRFVSLQKEQKLWRTKQCASFWLPS